MKKVIFGLALFGAIAANAAAVTWNTGVVAKPSEYGTGNAGLKGRGYAFEIGETAYKTWMLQSTTESIAAAMASIYAEYGSQTESTGVVAMDNGSGGGNKFSGGNGKFGTSASAEQTKYYAFVFTYLDSSSEISHYMANVASVTINESGDDGTVYKVANVFGGMTTDSGTTNMAWQSLAVPEPTSGLLLLLGVAGLALRRRRA